MRLIRSLSALGAQGKSHRVLTIGAFDGLHLGHLEIFRQAGTIAAESSASVTALTFEPTPAEYFAQKEPPARLTCFRERFERLDELGVEELICPRFGAVNALEHDTFVSRILVARLGVSHIVVGSDFRYGAGRRGDVDSLRRAGRDLGFGVTVVDAVYLDGRRVSSTRIREALQRGNLELAGRMLGRDYSMSGRVVHGLGLGADLGFPTANVNLKRRQAPVLGIFAVEVDRLGATPQSGVASVGNRPTVGGGKTLLEVFIFDFERNIYGAYITVRFKSRLRSEENFPTLEAMQRQMHVDVEAAKAALRG